MTRITFALKLLARMRHEKTPPLARYCIVLALAESPEPLTSREIGRRLGDELAVTGSLENALQNDLVIKHPPNPHATYSLSKKGIKLVATLVLPEQTTAKAS